MTEPEPATWDSQLEETRRIRLTDFRGVTHEFESEFTDQQVSDVEKMLKIVGEGPSATPQTLGDGCEWIDI